MADQDLGSALQRVQSYQYPATHVGHLSQEQQGALEKFKALCAQKGYYRPASGSEKASHDEETLLRYLRARKFIPNDAFGQFKDTEDWRKENKIDNLYNTIDVQEYEETRRLYPQWTGCRDKRGIPVYVFEVAHLTSKRMSEYEKSIANSKTTGTVSPKLIRLFALYENLLSFALPLCSGIPGRQFPETPISQSNNIVDISGVGLKQFWNLKQHMQDASTLATAHYPETLDRIFIIGAPSFFPTVWGWVKRWFDPITVSKIFILAQHEVKPTLSKYIDEANIPKKYGGRLDWEWGSLPNIEPAIANALKWEHPSSDGRGGRAFPLGPTRFETDSNGNMVAYSVGSEKGRPRHNKIATLPIAQGLNIGGIDAAMSHGKSSTEASGWHTHPAENQQTMPSSGSTPPQHHSPEIHPMVGATRDVAAGKTVSSNPDHPRTGTSLTSFEAQNMTHARGQLAEGTPVTIDQGYGDKHTMHEPSTIGQAPKDVSLPSREAPHAEASYLDQAKAAVHSAVVAAESAEEAVLEKLGYGHKEEEKKVETKQAPDDPRIAQLENKDVEAYLRSQYADYDRPGHRK